MNRLVHGMTIVSCFARCRKALVVCALLAAFLSAGTATAEEVPPPWKVLPVPRWVDYGQEGEFLPLKNVAIVRRPGSAYQTLRTADGELQPGSSVIEEDLTAALKELGIIAQSVADTAEACAPFDTLILLGPPESNAQSKQWFSRLGLDFARWKDPNTPEESFSGWPDLGHEGYVLKAGAAEGKTIIMLAGHDVDEARKEAHCAGTFYALQSFLQLLVKEEETVRVKTAEILDKPLLAIRGCLSGFSPDEEQEWRNVRFMARMKANQNVYWYGNALANYNFESASRFRYPWKPEQLEVFKRIGRYCRERFITMVFTMNPDHVQVEWAAAKSHDGTRKDSLHYNPDHPVEPEIQEQWRSIGFEVKSDIDILAAKFSQLHQVVPGALLQMMNEDDGFGLVHEDDKQLFNTATGDPEQDAIHYGKARGQLLISLYKRIQELHPGYSGMMPVCPPGSIVYHLALERNEAHSQAFMHSLGTTLREAGLAEAMPLITTGGGTAAEVVTSKHISDFRNWSAGAPAVLHDNNFAQGFHAGAYETDPNAQRLPWQSNPEYPSGYRDPTLYRYLRGVQWNGINDQQVLGWCQAQFMWNMAGLQREPLNGLAVRKVASEDAYPFVKSFYEEFDNPGCYLPDNQPPLHILVLKDDLAFPGVGQNGWQYDLKFTDDRRRVAQAWRDKWAQLKPELMKRWDAPLERTMSMEYLGDRADAFCKVYLAYGYLQGWEGTTEEDLLEGARLRDLLLEADEIQERFFRGPDKSPSATFVDRGTYTSAIRFIYTDGKYEGAPEEPSKAARYVDIWKTGLRDTFLTDLATLTPAQMRVEGDFWSEPQQVGEQHFRTLREAGTLLLEQPVAMPILVRMRVGSESDTLSDPTSLVIEAGGAVHEYVVCKGRWINVELSGEGPLDRLQLKASKPVRVYAVELYRPKLIP